MTPSVGDGERFYGDSSARRRSIARPLSYVCRQARWGSAVINMGRHATTSEVPTSEDAGAGRAISREHVIDLVAIVCLVFLMIIAVRTTIRLQHLTGLLVLAVVLSYLTAPLRHRLAARIGDGVAAALVPLLTFAVIVGIAVAVSKDTTSQATRLASMLNEKVRSLAPQSLPSRIARSTHVEEAIDQALSTTGTTVIAGQRSTGKLASPLSDLFIVIILGAFLQGAGPAVVARAISWWPRSRRATIWERWKLVDARAGSLLRPSILLMLATGLAVGTTCGALGIPGGLAMGAWAGLWVPVTTLGPAVGFGPYFVVALIQTDTSKVLPLLMGAILCGATRSVRRRINRRAGIFPGAGTWVLAYAVGYAVAGTGGLIIATGAVAFISAFQATPIEPVDPEATQRLPTRAERLFGVDGTEEWWRSILTQRGVAVVASTCILGTLAWVFLESLGVFTAWLFIGLLLSVGLDRPVAALVRRAPRVPRAAAASVVLTIFVGLIAGIFVLALQGAPSKNASLSTELPRAIQRFEHAPVIGPVLRHNDASEWVRMRLDHLPDTLSDSSTGRTLLPAIGARFGDLFWTLAITLALLFDGPRLVAEVRRHLPVRYRRQYGTLVDVAHEAVGGFLAGSAAIAALDALFVLSLALALRVPLAPALAGWAFLTNFVPQIGGLLGGTPLVVLAFAVGPIQALVALGAFLTYQVLENHLIGPKIISKATDISPVTALLTALVGGAAAGVVGALLLTPIVAAAKVMHDLTIKGKLPGYQPVPQSSAQIPAESVSGA